MGLSVSRLIINNPTVLNGLEKVGHLSTPANRLFLGATALATQPFFDINNKDVDKETREVSCARTISKIVVGTATGIAVRSGCIDLMKKFTQDPKLLEKQGKPVTPWTDALIPKNVHHSKFFNTVRDIEKHRQGIGSVVALGVMLFTNFLVDAPLTTIMTNLIKPEQKSDGGNK